jgi:crotonobetainyl-CoA:carnitine CoA-transferase CaiB-like acyl-CoA transferase
LHPEAGATRAIGCPIHFSATPAQITRPAPLLGQHTREILLEHGFRDNEIDELCAQGIVGDATRTLS